MSEENITISTAEYERLLDRDLWLECLESAGVDNWSGFDFAHEILDETKGAAK